MTIAGAGASNDIELLDLSSAVQTGPKPANYPINTYGLVCAHFRQQIWACGGVGVKACYIYVMGENIWYPSLDLDTDR